MWSLAYGVGVTEMSPYDACGDWSPRLLTMTLRLRIGTPIGGTPTVWCHCAVPRAGNSTSTSGVHALSLAQLQYGQLDPSAVLRLTKLRARCQKTATECAGFVRAPM